MLEHLTGSYRGGGTRRRRPRQLRSAHRNARQLGRLAWRVDDDEAEDDAAPVAPPGRRVHEQRLAHQVRRQPGHHVDGVVLGADLDVPGVRTARPGELGGAVLHPEHEDLGLDRPGDVEAPDRTGSPLLLQSGLAIAATPARVTFMLCASRPCRLTAGKSSAMVPLTSKPHSHRTRRTCLAAGCFAPIRRKLAPQRRSPAGKTLSGQKLSIDASTSVPWPWILHWVPTDGPPCSTAVRGSPRTAGTGGTAPPGFRCNQPVPAFPWSTSGSASCSWRSPAMSFTRCSPPSPPTRSGSTSA